MAELQIFKTTSSAIRTTIIDGKPYFAWGSDVQRR